MQEERNLQLMQSLSHQINFLKKNKEKLSKQIQELMVLETELSVEIIQLEAEYNKEFNRVVDEEQPKC